MLETNSARVALTLMAKEMEKNKELSVLRTAMEKLFLDFLAFYQRPGSETAKLKDHIRLLSKDVVKLKKMAAINQFGSLYCRHFL